MHNHTCASFPYACSTLITLRSTFVILISTNTLPTFGGELQEVSSLRICTARLGRPLLRLTIKYEISSGASHLVSCEKSRVGLLSHSELSPPESIRGIGVRPRSLLVTRLVRGLQASWAKQLWMTLPPSALWLQAEWTETHCRSLPPLP